MKIIIIGAGVSGLSTYLFFKKHFLSNPQDTEFVAVQIYEAYDVHKLDLTTESFPVSNPDEPLFLPTAIGNAIGISPNGLKVLSRLDEDGSMLQEVFRRGNSIDKWRMSNARGWTLADISTGGNSANYDPNDTVGNPSVVMIARQHLWEVLRDEVLKTPDAVVKKRISSVQIGRNGSTNTVEFEDGTTDQADLIVGADGLRSVVRRAMFETKEPHRSNHQTNNTGLLARFWTSNAKPSPAADYITPQYE